MRHQKRQAVPKNWGLNRKGKVFTVRAKAGEVPILVVLRDMLKIVKSKKECKRALYEKKIELNSKPIREVAQGIHLLDIITIVPSKKHYVIKLSKTGKFEAVETKDAVKKPTKVIGKTLLKGKKLQLNLIDGRNILSGEKCKTNDSVLFDFTKNKIEKILPMKKGSKVIVFAGKHAGAEGAIVDINEETKIATIKTKDDEIKALIKQMIVTE